MTIATFGPGEDGAHARDFVAAGAAIQQRQGRIVQSIDGTRRRLSASFHWSSYADMHCIVARRAGRVVARCAAFRNTRLDPEATGGARVGYIGMFECEAGHADAAREVLSAACEWLAEAGCDVAVGPMDCSTWYSYRLSLGPWSNERMWLEPDTPEAYSSMWRNAGFAEDERYFTARCDDLGTLDRYMGERRAAIREAGYSTRPIDAARLEEELRLLYDMSIASFVGNVYYSPIDWSEFRELYDGMTRVLDERMVQIVEGPDGDAAGFVLALPNYHRAAMSMRGKSGKLAGLRFLANRRHADVAIVKTLAIVPEHRSGGLGSEMVAIACDAARDAGYSSAYFALMHDTNHSRAISQHGGGVTAREYALFRRSL